MSIELKPVSEILVPVDFSDCSGRALVFAMRIAAASHSHLHLLNVVDDPMLIQKSTDDRFRQEQASKMSKKFLDVMSPEDRERFRATMVVRFGTAYYEIEKYAKEQDIELIVMGNTNRMVIADALLGSVTAHIVRHASCPVLTVNEH